MLLQCVALCRSVFQCAQDFGAESTVSSLFQQGTAVLLQCCCSVVAVCCRVLLCVAVLFSVLQTAPSRFYFSRVQILKSCRVVAVLLQCVVMCYSVLQCFLLGYTCSRVSALQNVTNSITMEPTLENAYK